MIRIVTNASNPPFNVSITDEEGTPLGGITGITIRIAPNAVVTAQIEVLAGPLDITAQPLLTREVLASCAASHGLRLVPIEHDQARVIASSPVSPPPAKPHR